MKLKGIIILLIAVITLSSHVPFLKPNQFVILHNRFHVESSFTEDPFQADFAMNSPYFYIIDPSGLQTAIEPSAKTSAAVYLEPTIKDSGTYRINAAQRKGPLYRGVETADGKKYFSKDTLTVKGKKIKLQYFSSADTYVCKGLPKYKPQPLNKSIEIIPLSSPNEIKVNESIKFKVLHDGKIVDHARVVIAYDDDHYVKKDVADLYDVENKRENNIFAGKDGVFAFTPIKPGLVLLFVNIHKKINDTHWESYNNSLTLEARLP